LRPVRLRLDTRRSDDRDGDSPGLSPVLRTHRHERATPSAAGPDERTQLLTPAG